MISIRIAGLFTIVFAFNEIATNSWFTLGFKQAVSCTSSRNIPADLTGLHNGDGKYPVVGDKITTSTQYNYDGGLSSFPNNYINATNHYVAYTILDFAIRSGNNFVGFLVVDTRTAEVVAKYDCP